MADPLLEAARELIDDSLDALVHELADLTAASLNAVPAGEGTNSLAVIATHALASTRSWLSLATGSALPVRDRPAEFRVVADEGFHAWLDREVDLCRELVASVTEMDPARVGAAPWRSGHESEPVSAAWALLHALAHLREHVGHAQLTKELLGEQ